MRVSRYAARLYQIDKTQETARVAALVLLGGYTVRDVGFALGIPEEHFRSTNARQICYQIRDWLDDIDVESLLAWQNAWSAPIRSKNSQ